MRLFEGALHQISGQYEGRLSQRGKRGPYDSRGRANVRINDKGRQDLRGSKNKPKEEKVITAKTLLLAVE